MTNELWLNLPVGDLERSKAFFTAIGWQVGGGPGDTPFMTPLRIGKKPVIVMLCDHESFQRFSGTAVADLSKGSEVLISVDAESKEEVDELVEKVLRAGGKSDHRPHEMQGMMYGCLFLDPDGHRWNVLYMK